MQAPRGWDNRPPIVNQPTAHSTRVDNVWESISRGPQVCPPGLENLVMLDQLLVRQKLKVATGICCSEIISKYDIENRNNQIIYKAIVKTQMCSTSTLLCHNRPFDMKIHDNNENMVIHLSRPLACQECCFPCCLQNIEIFAPPGQLVGLVKQEWSICTSLFYPVFTIRNPANEVVFHINGPCCVVPFCRDVEFKVMSADGLFQVGTITKKWSDILTEIFTDIDDFCISFPMNLDVAMKAVLLGACFLIDFMFYESDNPGNQASF